MSTKAERKRELEAAAWKVRCIKCGAAPGEGCVSPDSGARTGMRRERIREAGYLPIVDEPPK